MVAPESLILLSGLFYGDYTNYGCVEGMPGDLQGFYWIEKLMELCPVGVRNEISAL